MGVGKNVISSKAFSKLRDKYLSKQAQMKGNHDHQPITPEDI